MTQTYTTVTELPGSGATSEQLAMLYARYALAAGFSRGKDVVEVACGPGIGLGYLARWARRVVGGEFVPNSGGLGGRLVGNNWLFGRTMLTFDASKS